MWELLNNLVKKRDMTIKDLAKKSGVSYSTIRDTKFRDISFSKVCKIADALDVSLDEFRKEE